MKTHVSACIRRQVGRLACLGLLLPMSVAAQPEDDEDDELKIVDMGMEVEASVEPAPRTMVFEFDADMAAPEMPDVAVDTPGVAVGGARDVDLVRSRLESGRIPEPALLASEGFLAEYDLPLTPAPRCSQKLCINTQTVATSLIARPAVHYLTQLGFGSNLDMSTFQRPPLYAVVVLDLSPSMRGSPLATAQAAIIEVANQLRPGDQLTIVGFGVKPVVLLPATPMPNVSAVHQAVAYTEVGGGTALERGLHAGVQLARRAPAGYATRVFLITDDRPTVGRTSGSPFVNLAKRSASQGVSLTTIGVGPHFQAPLARALAAVRGGNTMYVRDPLHASSRIAEEFPALVTELAYALEVVIDPAPGMAIEGVFGVPGDMLVRDGDKVSLRVETLFLSKKRGAIFLALAPKGRANLPRGAMRTGAHLGTVHMQYRDLDGSLDTGRSQLRNIHPGRTGKGLQRGALLIEQMEVLRAISERTTTGVGREARAMAEKLSTRFTNIHDPELTPAVELTQMLRDVVGRSTTAPR